MPRRARSSTAALAGVAIVLSTMLTAAAPAAAGSYSVRQCDWASANGHHDFVWQGAGTPAIALYQGSGCGEFGLAARNGNGGHEQTYPNGGYGGWFAYAPPGTVITAFSGAFGVLEGCCINGMATYAEATEQPTGAGGHAYLFQGNLGGSHTWQPPSGVQGPVGRAWSASTTGFAARRVGFYLRCGPGWSCFQTRYGDLRLRGRSFDFTLRDDVPPTITAAGGSLLAGGWQRGARTLSVSAGDGGGGLTGVSAQVAGGPSLAGGAACVVAGGRYARLRPCPLGHGATWAVNTAALRDGTHAVTLRATDVGGAVAATTRWIAVDNGAPAAPSGLVVAGGEGWRAANGFTVSWANPTGQHAPIARARYELCPVGSGGCVTGERTEGGVTDSGAIALPRPGQWDVRVWLEDAAGNADPATASGARRLRWDPEPPVLRETPPEATPDGLIAFEVEDRSGLADGAIELRPSGAGGWIRLPTTVAGGRLEAALDGAGLPPGTYEVRGRAVDRAGNAAAAAGRPRTVAGPPSGDGDDPAPGGGVDRPGGGPPPRTLRVPTPTVLSAAFVVRRPARARCRRKRACGRTRTVRRSKVRVRRGTRLAIRGRLLSASGRPLAGRRIAVTLASEDRDRRLPGVRTGRDGRIALSLRARRSATVTLALAGDADTLASRARLALAVPAPVTIARPPGRVAGGTPIRFHGRVRGRPIPRRGKLVEVQAHFRGRWRTISTVRSRRDGRWRFRYAFRAAARAATYRMRARAPAEAGYPFADGASRAIRVTVRGASR